MTLHVLYRLYPPENHKRRPEYHDKASCLKSFLLAARQVPGCTFTVLVDSTSLPTPFRELLVDAGVDVEFLGGIGNVASYAVQLDRACSFAPHDLVYLSEDDYLCVPEALSVLAAAAEGMPEVDYFTLYDHPDRYRRRDDAPIRSSRLVWHAGGRHWRRTESTCMSYAARVAALRADAGLHRASSSPRFPDDRKIWRRTQGLSTSWWRRSKRILVSPIPSLATHMDEDNLAPGVDWSDVAAALRRDDG